MTHRRSLALILAAGLALPVALADPALAADLPLRAVTLYRSGVGSFDHTGTVTGDETIHLRFEADRVNDILKSMVLLDFGGGHPVGASYMPNQPLARRLEDFRINPLTAGNVIGLMRQLIGTRVELTTPGGTVTGVVMGVEQRPVTIGAGDAAKVMKDWAVTLVTKTGVSTTAQAEIRSFKILDESLAAELSRALAAVAQRRDDRYTNVDVAFAGTGERRVAVSYTHGAPVWKTSYRLILPTGTDAKPSIQGWAIVENDTDEDWAGVHLSLASGRPVSFTMDLQTPLILARPNAPVPVIATLGPTMYQNGRRTSRLLNHNGVEMTFKVETDESRQREGALAAKADRSDASDQAKILKGLTTFSTSNRNMFGDEVSTADQTDRTGALFSLQIFPALQAAASAGDVGEQFIYTIDAPVSIDKGASAMLPIISGPIDGRRVSIYSWTGPNSRPMLGIDLTNDTGLHLMPGPIAVYDAGAYAGDAEIGHIARGDDRLLAFAVDHDLEVSREQKTGQDVRKIRIVNGVVVRTNVSRQTTTYTFTNDDPDTRTVLIEHPKTAGWDVVGASKPVEQTDTLYRFEANVEPGETKDVVITLERVWSQSLSTNGIGLDELFGYVRNGKASQAVYDAVKKAGGIQTTINDFQSKIARQRVETSEITQDQDRIRKNMNTVNRQTDLYTRYMKKLAAQETRLEDLHDTRADLERRLTQARADLRAYLADLDVD